MSSPNDPFSANKIPARSSTPAPRTASKPERMISFLRRASTPAPGRRPEIQLLSVLQNVQNTRPTSIDEVPIASSAHPLLSSSGREQDSGPVHGPRVSPIFVAARLSVPSIPNTDISLNDDPEWRPRDLWHAVRSALQVEGVYIPNSNLWENWPNAQRWQRSDRVLLVKQRSGRSEVEDVYLKAVKRRSIELKVLKHLLSPTLRGYSALACPPVMRIIELATFPSHSFFTMPPLVPLDIDDMETVGDCLDFVRQVLEGLVFLHSQGISHGDLNRKNIMIVPSSLGMSPRQVHIRSSRRMHYCFIDFGMSTYFQPGEVRLRKSGDGPRGAPPEIRYFRVHGGRGYDPFPADVWMLGQLIKPGLIHMKKNLRFLDDWAEAMYVDEVTVRPTAEDALRSFYGLITGLTREDCENNAVVGQRIPDWTHLLDSILAETSKPPSKA